MLPDPALFVVPLFVLFGVTLSRFSIVYRGIDASRASHVRRAGRILDQYRRFRRLLSAATIGFPGYAAGYYFVYAPAEFNGFVLLLAVFLFFVHRFVHVPVVQSKLHVREV